MFFGHFEALQVLMIMSLVFAAGGFVLLFLYHKREKACDPLKTNIGILCAITWGIAGKLMTLVCLLKFSECLVCLVSLCFYLART